MEIRKTVSVEQLQNGYLVSCEIDHAATGYSSFNTSQVDMPEVFSQKVFTTLHEALEDVKFRIESVYEKTDEEIREIQKIGYSQ